MEGYEIDNDLDFLKKMQEQTKALLNGRYDITRVETLDRMVGDWIHELEKKKKKTKKPK